MGWFEKFTLSCVVLVITSLSLILIGSVELLHSAQNRINGNSLALLEELRVLRMQEWTSRSGSTLGLTQRPLLAIVIRSSRVNYELRKIIRHTWAREDYRVVHRFVLAPVDPPRGVTSDKEPSVGGWLARLNRRGTIKTAQYYLFVDDTVFVNTRVVLEALGRTTPTKNFVLCVPRKDELQNSTATHCDTSHPVLLSGDVMRSKSIPPIRDGSRLQLSRRDTEAIFHRQIADITRLVYFFSAPLDQLSSSALSPTLMIGRLWEAVNGSLDPIDA